MFKKLIIYFMAAYIAFFPVYRASAGVPLVLGAVVAVELAAPHIIRYVASEVAIRSIIKGFQLSNAYYSGVSKLANSKFITHFKGKAALGVTAFTAVLAAIGYSISSDGVVVKEDSGALEADKMGVAGKYWNSGGHISDTANGAAQKDCDTRSSCASLELYDSKDVSFHYHRVREDGLVITTAGIAAYIFNCDSDSIASSCKDGYIPPSKEGKPVDEATLEKELLEHIPKMPFDKQVELIANEKGVIDADLAKDFQTDNAPPMPDGETPIPNIEEQAWKNAHLIVKGEAQSLDPSQSNYVSTADWDEAYYLAHSVANGNPLITGANAGVITSPVPNTGEDNTGTEVVDVSGIESRLDTGNTLTQSVIDEISKMNQSSVVLNTAPSDSAQSFWPVKYPNGIAGVLTKFISDMKQTPILQWLDTFVININAGSIPAFDLCFNVIGSIDFGCYSLSADAYIWSAIKASMILLAVIVSRKIVFGG